MSCDKKHKKKPMSIKKRLENKNIEFNRLSDEEYATLMRMVKEQDAENDAENDNSPIIDRVVPSNKYDKAKTQKEIKELKKLKKAEIKASKNLKKRQFIISNIDKQYQERLRSQKRELIKTRETTLATLENINNDIKNIELESMSELTVKKLKHIFKMNKFVHGSYNALEIDSALNNVIFETIKKASDKIYKNSKIKISKKDLHYLINKHLEHYFSDLVQKYKYLKYDFEFKTNDTIPKIASVDIDINENKIKNENKCIIDENYELDLLDLDYGYDDVVNNPTKIIE